MARLFTSREIATLAMRKCGVIPYQDTAADDQKTAIALSFLDLMLSEKSSTTRLWSLVAQGATFTYTADADSVDITALLGSNRLDIYRYAYVDDTDEPITLIMRDDFDKIKNSGNFPFAPGRTLYIATDGDDTYTAYLRPVPTTALLIRITGQSFSPTVSLANKNTDVDHDLERAFQRWMVTQLACDIGDGPLARLPQERLLKWQGEADLSWAKVNNYRGGGQRPRSRFTRSWDG